MTKLSAFERLVRCHPACQRFNPHDPDSDCWEWTGSRDAKGYGFISVNGRTRRVHIVAWELATGRKLRKGYTLQHKCRNPSCWRPSHVEVMSRSRNTADGNRNNPRSTEKARAVKAAKVVGVPETIRGAKLRVAVMDEATRIMAEGRDSVFDAGYGGIG